MIRSVALPWLVAASMVAAPCAGQTLAGQPSAAAAGSAPIFHALRLDGTPFDSAELAGGFVLLDFWGVWCPPCIGAFPKLSRLHETYADRGFQVLGLAVLSGTPEEVAEFLEDHDVTYPIVVVEREVPDLFEVRAYPTYILVGADGAIVREYRGQPNDLYEIVSEDLERVLPAANSGTD